MLTLGFDTATETATCALVDGDEVLGERSTVARSLLEDVDALLRQAGARPAQIERLAVGLGPGSFTSTRVGLSLARGLGLALGVQAAGVSTLDALAAGGEGLFPVIDAKRREVFVQGPRAVRPEELELDPGTVCVGDGALRYRDVLTALGASVPSDDSALHVPRARFHVALARVFRPAEFLEPIYVRVPDAELASA